MGGDGEEASWHFLSLYRTGKPFSNTKPHPLRCQVLHKEKKTGSTLELREETEQEGTGRKGREKEKGRRHSGKEGPFPRIAEMPGLKGNYEGVVSSPIEGTLSGSKGKVAGRT